MERRYPLTTTGFAYWSVAEVATLQTGRKESKRRHYKCQLSGGATVRIHAPTRFFWMNQSSSFDSFTAWCKASPNHRTCFFLIQSVPAFWPQYSPQTCPYRSNGVRLQRSPPGTYRHSSLPYWYSMTHFDYSGPYLQHTRQHLWNTTSKWDTWVMKTVGKFIKINAYIMSISQTMMSLVICASEANGNRRDLWSFLGMKFDGDVLKSLRQSTSYFNQDLEVPQAPSLKKQKPKQHLEAMILFNISLIFLNSTQREILFWERKCRLKKIIPQWKRQLHPFHPPIFFPFS